MEVGIAENSAFRGCTHRIVENRFRRDMSRSSRPSSYPKTRPAHYRLRVTAVSDISSLPYYAHSPSPPTTNCASTCSWLSSQFIILKPISYFHFQVAPTVKSSPLCKLTSITMYLFIMSLPPVLSNRSHVQISKHLKVFKSTNTLTRHLLGRWAW